MADPLGPGSGCRENLTALNANVPVIRVWVLVDFTVFLSLAT